MRQRTIIGMFENTGISENTLEDLERAGIDRSRIDVVRVDAGTVPRLDDLSDLELPDTDARTYEEGIRRGHTLIVARADETDEEKVVAIMRSNGAMDIDACARQWGLVESESWKTEGESGKTERREDMPEPIAGTPTTAGTESTTPVEAATPMAVESPDARAETHEAVETEPVETTAEGQTRESSTSIIEEPARFEKRPVTREAVHIHKEITETPVEETVLREEKVIVEHGSTGQQEAPVQETARTSDVEVDKTEEPAKDIRDKPAA